MNSVLLLDARAFNAFLRKQFVWAVLLHVEQVLPYAGKAAMLASGLEQDVELAAMDGETVDLAVIEFDRADDSV